MNDTEPDPRPCYTCGRPAGPPHDTPRVHHPYDPTPRRLQAYTPPTGEDRARAVLAERVADILAARQERRR